MAVFKGDCSLLIDGGLGNTRRYSLRTENVTGAPANRTTWEGNADTSITLYFRNETTGATPPGDADTAFELLVYYETGTGTLIKTLYSGAAPPADGTSYTLHLTANGDSGGGARCGQLRLYIRADRNAIVAYDRNSDNTGGSGTAGTGDQGCIRSNMLVSDLAVSAYPAGSKFAYGTAADETFTLTATHTQKYADTNNETFDIAVLNSSDSTVESVADLEVGAGTTTAQAFTVDDTYATGDNNYGFKFTVNNNGSLLTTEKWTVPVDNGANVTQDGTNAVKRSSFYVVNPDVTFVSVAPGQTVYNRGEAATVTFGIQNARSQAVTRQMTALVKDSSGTTKKTITDTGSTYGDGGSSDYTIGATDKASYDLVGDQWTLVGNVAGARFTNTPNVYKVSRMWTMSVNDAAPAEASVWTGTGASPGSDAKTVFNRGQQCFFHTHIFNCRGEHLANQAINFNVRPVGSETYDEAANDTDTLVTMGGTTGHFGHGGAKYTVDTDETVGGKALVVASSSTTAGANQPRTGTAGDGNFAESNLVTPEWTVSATYTVLTRTQKESTRNADAMDTQFTIGEDVIYQFGNVVDASGAPVDWVGTASQVNPSGSTTQSFAMTGAAASGGWSADPGQAFDSRAPAGGGWLQRTVLLGADNQGNSGSDDQAISMLSAFTANKNICIFVAAVAAEDRHIRVGESIRVLITFRISGIRTAADTGGVTIAISKKIANDATRILQADGSFADTALVEFECAPAAQTGVYVCTFGAGMEHAMDMANFVAGKYQVLVKLLKDGQEFRDDEDFEIFAAINEHDVHAADTTTMLDAGRPSQR